MRTEKRTCDCWVLQDQEDNQCFCPMTLPTGVRKGYQGRFRASLHIDGKRVSLGNNFKTAKEAGEAYQEARAKHPKKTGLKQTF